MLVTCRSHSLTSMNALLDLCYCLARIEALGANSCAIHDCLASVELVSIIQLLKTLLGELITTVNDPPAHRITICLSACARNKDKTCILSVCRNLRRQPSRLSAQSPSPQMKLMCKEKGHSAETGQNGKGAMHQVHLIAST